MPSFRILIVEDIVLTAIDLRNSLERNGYIVSGIARNLREVQEVVDQSPPDLALVDIMLEGSDVSGVEIAQYLHKQYPIPIIYLTANSEVDQFRKAQTTHPAAYLLKPFKMSDVLFNVELAYHNFQRASQNTFEQKQLMLPTKAGLELINLDDVSHLKAVGAYTEIVLGDGTVFLISSGLGQTGQYFQEPDFYRISRSFLVNKQYIKRIKEGEILLRDGKTRIALPEGARKGLLNRFTVLKTKNPK